MYQQDRGSFRKQESLLSEFSHSCLGRLILFVAIVTVLAILAIMTKPSEQTMREEMTDNIRQCIEANDSIATDWIDDAVNNVGYIFTEADTLGHDGSQLSTFNQYNRLEYYDHTLFATMRLFNNYRVEGVRCAIGIFGIVIPTVNFNDFLLRVGPMRKDYNQPIIRTNIGDDEYIGENPDLGGVFEYEGE